MASSPPPFSHTKYKSHELDPWQSGGGDHLVRDKSFPNAIS